jgi:hypothetical protein
MIKEVGEHAALTVAGQRLLAWHVHITEATTCSRKRATFLQLKV